MTLKRLTCHALSPVTLAGKILIPFSKQTRARFSDKVSHTHFNNSVLKKI